MKKFRKPFLFALSLLPIALVAGALVSLYQLDILSEDMLAELTAQVGDLLLLIPVGAAQAAGYALFCGFFGYVLADRTGLWKPVRFEKNKLAVTLAVSAVGGVLLSLDHWVFGGMIRGIQETNAAGLTVVGVLASVLYGGIIEEVLLRLFMMSLIAWLLWKVFCRKRLPIPNGVFLGANVIAALLFAAGHLPATAALFGELTPLLLLRCFLLNGGFGLIFGWLYRKYGIVYAMVSHSVFHIVCKLIWFLLI